MELPIKKFPISNFQFPFKSKIRNSKFETHWRLKSGNRRLDLNSGQLLVELLVAFGLAAILIPAIVFGFISGVSGKVQQEQRLKATGLLKEGEEAVRSVRDIDNTGWITLTTPNCASPLNPCHAVAGASSWSLQTGSESVGDFTRSIFIDDASPTDLSKKQITVTVSWNSTFPTSLSSTFILTRWKNLPHYPMSAGGPINGQGYGDWCNPSTYIVGSYDLGSIPIAITAIPSATLNYTYASTGENRSSGTPVYGLTVSHANPPAILNPASSTDNAKAYGIFTDGTYTYFTEANPGPTVRIARASDLVKVGFFNAAKNGAGSVYVTGVAGTPGAIGYVAVGTTLYSFNLATIGGLSTSQAQLDSISITGSAKKVIVTGSNVYVVTDSTSAQLQIIPVLAGGNLDENNVKNINLGNSQAGVDLSIDPLARYAYVVTNYSSGNDLFVVDIANTNNIYGYTTHINSGQPGSGDMNPRGVAAVAVDKIVVVGCNGDNGGDHCSVNSSGWNYQVFNVPSNPNNPSNVTRCGGMVPTKPDGTSITSINAIAGITQSNGDSFSYIVDGVNSSAQFQIVAGGAGGGGGNTGVFESELFDCRTVVPACTSPVVFNRFIEIPSPTPAGVTTSYQVAVSMDCSTFNYTGSFDASGGQIPLNINPGYCFKYKVTFTNAGGATNASTNVSVNYSP